jgi:hypothetical protein
MCSKAPSLVRICMMGLVNMLDDYDDGIMKYLRRVDD